MTEAKLLARRYRTRPVVSRYAVAVVVVALATGVRLLLTPWIGDQFPFATLFLAVLIAAWYGGFWPGLTSSVAGAAASALFLLPDGPVLTFPNKVGLVLYLIVSVAIAALGGVMRAARLRADALANAALKREEALRESEQRYRDIVERAHEGIWQLDADGRTRFANRRMAEMLGCTPEELRGKRIEDFVDAEGREQVELLRERRRQGIAEHAQLRLQRRDGTDLWTLLSAAPTHDANGNYQGVLGMLSDITEWKNTERDNERLYTALRDADRRKDEFLALLGHELRNPLAPISNSLHVLKLRGADPAILERARAVMERQLEHLVRLVDDLLDVSRIMRGKVELRREPVEIAMAVARAVETAQPALDAEGHELVLSLCPEPLWIDGDIVRLAQVIANLLNNAAKYTERGGRITLVAEAEEGAAVVRVRDSGIGIAPEMLSRIFDMFFQAERRTNQAHGGLGIGLSLVRGLIELHGGSVEARSDGVGTGSEFIVRLPLLQVTGTVRAKPLDALEIMPVPLSARRVLIVDDNVDAADSLATLLRLHGQEVNVVYDGAAALASAEAHPPAIAFFDLGMPKMDGYELARRFRAHPVLKSVRLVALTGWGQPEDRNRTAEHGFDQHLVKPVAGDALRRLLGEPINCPV